MTRIALVPGALALLPEYASRTDPVAPLRRACLDAVAWLGPDVRVVASPQGERVAGSLLSADFARSEVPDTFDGPREAAYLVVGNGTACRTEKAPGHLDPRADLFDRRIALALGVDTGTPDPAALRSVDPALAEELWADLTCLPRLADLLDGARTTAVDYAADPFGVMYWVLRWRA
ncbi:hypothetical protein [Nocardioides insulae]|uniref:hypothetical protein n=1 Tax=Nocardioides insulae TaxID=394734 RepID=UPI00040C8595|nr:hypothetical protein [Nocardioides insulae]